MQNCPRAVLSLCLMSGFAGLVRKLWPWFRAVPSPRHYSRFYFACKLFTNPFKRYRTQTPGQKPRNIRKIQKGQSFTLQTSLQLGGVLKLSPSSGDNLSLCLSRWDTPGDRLGFRMVAAAPRKPFCPSQTPHSGLFYRLARHRGRRGATGLHPAGIASQGRALPRVLHVQGQPGRAWSLPAPGLPRERLRGVRVCPRAGPAGSHCGGH